MTDTTNGAREVHGAEADRWGGWTWREPSRGTDQPGDDWIRPSDVPPDVNTDGWYDPDDVFHWVQLGTRPVHHAKFYTQHLADPAIDREVLEQIQRTCGLRFHFDGVGGIGWQPYVEQDTGTGQ